MILLKIVRKIQGNLAPDLLTPYWRKVARGPLDGHCYIASESLFHLWGKERGYKPYVMTHKTWDYLDPGETHWFLKNASGTIADPTAEQFSVTIPYEKSKGCGFLTREPSRRCRIVMDGISYCRQVERVTYANRS